VTVGDGGSERRGYGGSSQVSGRRVVPDVGLVVGDNG
jgi:hypothetical protein